MVTATTITVTWQPVPGEYLPGKFDGYQVYSAEDVDALSAEDSLTKENWFDLVDLKPGRNYHFAVAAKSNGSMGPLSNISFATTDSGMLRKNLAFIFLVQNEWPVACVCEIKG